MVPDGDRLQPPTCQLRRHAEQVAAAAPDLTVLVTYEEGFNLLSSLVSAVSTRRR
jgi:hypothetical protein